MKTRNELANDYHNRLPEGPFQKSFVHGAFVDGYDAGYQAAQPQWISVKERLPEIPDTRSMSEDVLWLTRYGEMEVSCLERLRSEFRVDWGEAGLLKLDQFTHWMPLPEPPKK